MNRTIAIAKKYCADNIHDCQDLESLLEYYVIRTFNDFFNNVEKTLRTHDMHDLDYACSHFLSNYKSMKVHKYITDLRMLVWRNRKTRDNDMSRKVTMFCNLTRMARIVLSNIINTLDNNKQNMPKHVTKYPEIYLDASRYDSDYSIIGTEHVIHICNAFLHNKKVRHASQ